MGQMILARHGESEFSSRALLNGEPSVRCPLTPAGIDQARALGEALRDEPIELVVTTEFERTRETADEALRGRILPRLVIPELNDPRAGEFEGRPIEEYRAWAHSATSASQPGELGESRQAVVARYADGFRQVLDRPEAVVLVVAHSLPISYALAARDGSPPVARMPFAEYATAYRFSHEELARAVALLDGWVAAPTW